MRRSAIWTAIVLAVIAASSVDAQEIVRGQPRAAPPRQTAPPVNVSARDLAQLDWVIGRFRVVGKGGLTELRVSYEEYARDGSDAIVMRGFRDSTFTTERGSVRFELRDGKLWAGMSVVTAIAVDSLRLEATVGDDRTQTWRRVDGDHWVIEFTPRAGEARRWFEMWRVR